MINAFSGLPPQRQTFQAWIYLVETGPIAIHYANAHKKESLFFVCSSSTKTSIVKKSTCFSQFWKTEPKINQHQRKCAGSMCRIWYEQEKKEHFDLCVHFMFHCSVAIWSGLANRKTLNHDKVFKSDVMKSIWQENARLTPFVRLKIHIYVYIYGIARSGGLFCDVWRGHATMLFHPLNA